jgi:TRAP-type C4-dicarboxylate transport system substrate-binding protein
MDIDSKRRKLLAVLASMGLAAPFVAGRRSGAQEEPITMRYTTHVPRSHGFYTKAFLPFAELVERETRGRLRLEVYTDKMLHGPLDAFKATVTGITDYTNAYVTYQPGSFKLLHAPQLPFLFPSPQVASLVFEELYPRYFKAEYERMGVYLAHCDCTSPYNIISKTPIRRLEDLGGLKIRVTAGLTAEIYRELGAVQYCLNRDTFDGLPADLQASFYQLLRVRSQMAVQSIYSGAGHEDAMRVMREAGTEMIVLDDSERARWRDRVAPLKERFISQYESEGLPARAAVTAMEGLASEYATLTNAQINDRIRNAPVQGIIDL